MRVVTCLAQASSVARWMMCVYVCVCVCTCIYMYVSVFVYMDVLIYRGCNASWGLAWRRHDQ